MAASRLQPKPASRARLEHELRKLAPQQLAPGCALGAVAGEHNSEQLDLVGEQLARAGPVDQLALLDQDNIGGALGLLSAFINWPIKERPVDRLALVKPSARAPPAALDRAGPLSGGARKWNGARPLRRGFASAEPGEIDSKMGISEDAAASPNRWPKLHPE